MNALSILVGIPYSTQAVKHGLHNLNAPIGVALYDTNRLAEDLQPDLPTLVEQKAELEPYRCTALSFAVSGS
jgi:hypothetical protein